MRQCNQEAVIVVGLDLGDRFSYACGLGSSGTVCRTWSRIPTSQSGVTQAFASLAPCRIALEAGTHSPWLSRVLTSLGHDVLVANPRELRAISKSHKKNDRRDAEMLARIAALDPTLLAPIHHRGSRAQAHLAILRAREELVRSRTALVNHVRGAVKSVGHRLPRCSTPAFPDRVEPLLPTEVAEALEPLLATIRVLSTQIRSADKRIEQLCRTEYPETERLRQVRGVGPLLSLAFVLTIDDKQRFRKSRHIGAYFGLTPRLHDSSARVTQLRISKRGDPFLRRLLVTSVHYILGPFGEDCELRRAGVAIGSRGGANGKKRAVVAVARKLAVLLHRLWVSGTEYQPLRQAA